MQTQKCFSLFLFGFSCLILSAQPVRLSPTLLRQYQTACDLMRNESVDSAQQLMRHLLRQPEVPEDWREIWIGDTLHLIGSRLYEQRELARSEKNLLAAYTIRLPAFLDSSRAETCNRLGMLYREFSRYEEALRYYQESLRLKDRLHGPAHILTAHTLNNMGNLYRTRGKYPEALTYYQKASKIYLDYPADPETQAITLHNIGLVYQRMGDYEQAETYYNKSLRLRQQNLPPIHPEIGRSWYSLSTLAISRGNYDEALYCIQEARKVWSRSQVTIPEFSYSEVVLGIVYAEKGDFEQAIQFMQAALEFNLQRYGSLNPNVAGMYNNLASMALMNHQYADAERYTLQGLEILEQLFSPDHSDVKSAQYLLGQVLIEQNRVPEAIPTIQKSIIQNAAGSVASNPFNAGVVSLLGKAYSLQGEGGKAKAYYQQSINLYHQFGLQNSVEFAETYQQAATTYAYNGDWEAAWKLLEQGRQVLKMDLSWEIQSLPPLPNPFAAPVLLNNLQTQSNLYYAHFQSPQGSQEDLKRAWQSIQWAMALVDSMRVSFTSAGSKELLFERTFPVFEAAINYCWELYQLDHDEQWKEEAFRISEKNKSLLLFEALKDHHARQFAGIPDSVLRQERKLSSELVFLEKQLFETERTESESNLAQTRNQILSLRALYEQLIQRLENDYPEYYALKYQMNTASLKDIQRQARQDESAWISYFIGEQSSYAFVIQAETVSWQKLAQENELAHWVAELRSFLTPDRAFTQSSTHLAEISHQLYQYLLADLGPLPEQMVIIPDGLLGYVPFDFLPRSLPRQPDHYRDWDYLIHAHRTSYAYSATLHLYSLKTARPSMNNRLLAFAPSFPPEIDGLYSSSRQGLGALTHNKEEVTRLHRLIEGASFVDQQASEAAFKAQVQEYSLIHIASHALVNDQNPRYSHIRFTPGADSLEDGSLELAELFNLRINAEMVVLSACETGLGKLQRGEGIVSLARGMSYAGARSVVTTLWQVNDAATTDIMTDFYQGLQNGLPKDEALRRAKIHYLEQSDHPSAHPFYWAAYVPIGNMAPLSTPIWSQRYFIVMLLLLLVAGGLYIHRRNPS